MTCPLLSPLEAPAPKRVALGEEAAGVWARGSHTLDEQHGVMKMLGRNLFQSFYSIGVIGLSGPVNMSGSQQLSLRQDYAWHAIIWRGVSRDFGLLVAAADRAET